MERGAFVAGGEALIRLDRRSASLAEEEARAQAEAARTQQSLTERECARSERLWAAGAINGADHDRARAQDGFVAVLSGVRAGEKLVATITPAYGA